MNPICIFFFAEQIGDSLYDEKGAAIVQKLADKAKEKKVKLVFPVDFVTANKFAEDAKVRTERLDEQQIIRFGIFWVLLECCEPKSCCFCFSRLAQPLLNLESLKDGW